MEPNFDDAYEQDLKDIAYTKAVEALIPVVKEDYTVFDNTMRDHFEDFYNDAREQQLRDLHKAYIAMPHHIALVDIKYVKWLEYVEREAKRRVDG